MGLQLGEIHRSSLESLELLGSLGCSDPRRSSWPGMTSWPATLGYGVGPSRVANDASSASNPTSRTPLTLGVVWGVVPQTKVRYSVPVGRAGLGLVSGLAPGWTWRPIWWPRAAPMGRPW